MSAQVHRVFAGTGFRTTTLAIVADETKTFPLRGERRRLSRIYGYSVCGELLGHSLGGRPVLCALPAKHSSPHLPPRD